MKTVVILLLAFFSMTVTGCNKNPETCHSSVHRGVYHWKTTYNPTAWEHQWMKDHKVDKLYIRLFDVDAGEKTGDAGWTMVPTATTVFRQKLPADIEVVPVVYITLDAIRAIEDGYSTYDNGERYAGYIVKRIFDMMGEHYEGTVHEVQIDCDWTQQTCDSYFVLAYHIKQLLHDRDVILSGTLRLHQLREVGQSRREESYWTGTDTIPFDRSLLMCYNTGRLQDPDTKNSILDFDDVEPYLKQYHSDSLPRTDVAYPVYTWGVDFDDSGNFLRLVNSQQIAEAKSRNLRVETGEPKEIMRTQSALPELDSSHTVILYHLDSLNLSKYSHEDIEAFYSR